MRQDLRQHLVAKLFAKSRLHDGLGNVSAAKSRYVHFSRKVGCDLIGLGANSVAGDFQSQLFPALFLVCDCYVQALFIPFEAYITSRSRLAVMILMRKGGLEPPHLT